MFFFRGAGNFCDDLPMKEKKLTILSANSFELPPGSQRPLYEKGCEEMKLTEVKEIAKRMGIRLGKMNKTELIRAIQMQEENAPCFGTVLEFCDQENCLWRSDCIHE